MNEQKSPLELLYKDYPLENTIKRLSTPNPISIINQKQKQKQNIIFDSSIESNNNNEYSNAQASPQNQINNDKTKRRRGQFLGENQLIKRNNSIHLTLDQAIKVPSSINTSAKNPFIDKIKTLLLSHAYSIFILIATFIYLLYDDFRTLTSNAKYDNWIDGFFCVIMLLLLIDFILNIIFIAGFFFSAFCLNELIAFMIMIFEIDRVLLFFGINLCIKNKEVNWNYLHIDNQRLLLFITRFVKVIKLIRIEKMYKVFFSLLRAREVKQLIKRAKERISIQKKKLALKMKLKSLKTIKQTDNRIKNNLVSNYNRDNLFYESRIDSIPSSNIKMINHHNDPNMITNQLNTDRSKYIVKRGAAIVAKPENNNEAEEKKAENEPKIATEDYEESKVSQQISDSIITKMIIIIILIFLVNTVIDEDNYNKSTSNYSLFLKYLNTIQSQPRDTNLFPDPNIFSHWLIENQNIDSSFFPIISITLNTTIVYINNSLSSNQNEYRYNEIGFIYDNIDTMMTFSTKAEAKLTSITNIGRTVYITIIVFALSFLINLDGKKLIFNPLNKMINVVNVVAQDPVNSKTLDELKTEIDSNIKTQKKKDEDKLDTETKVIQMAIIRICSLMAIGFGEAGGEILKENISSSETLNPMLQGKRVQAIFGFCYIRRFQEINEALQERTMVFVNQISDIVHSSVDKFGGITNKNLGDCFLLVWKFTEKESKTVLPHEDKISFHADSALLSYLNIIKKINKSQLILNYQKDPALVAKLGERFSIQMGFGLHSGWGIEGAIGSFYKIDCSYLSPNVNIAARLETATNIYGVDILFSGELYDLLSLYMKKKCREIDIVTLKGSETPVRLYTVDINKNIQPGKLKNSKVRMNIRERRIFYFNKKKKLIHKYDSECKRKTILEVYSKMSKGMRQLLSIKRSELFHSYFDEGFTSYISGEWEDAYENFNKALYLDKNDGPTKTIMNYIKNHNLKAPNDWDGYRVLSSKS